MNNSNNSDNNTSFFFVLGVLANLCQLYDLNLNLNQTSNDEIMKGLQEQDKILQNDINYKLDIIIKQNEEIIKRLEINLVFFLCIFLF